MPSAATVRGPELRRIAVITTDTRELASIEKFLSPRFDVRLLDSWTRVAPLMSELPLDAVLLDLDTQGVPPAQALDVLLKFREISGDILLVALTRTHDHDLRRRAADAAVDELFVAPVNFTEMQVVLDRALDKRAMEIESRRLSAHSEISGAGRYSFFDLIGGSEPMRRVYDAILRLANSDTTVILRGESGTGKELVARSIVKAGARRDRPFVSLNCAALPESLIEAELFGHEKGSFTGAHAARPGLIETAHTGTLFLDEIGSLPPELQSKFLRVLEEHTVQRLGARRGGQHVDFRLITATNEDLEDAVRCGRFREDLYYRIHVVPVFLPPLRERHGDIPLLADHFLRLYCASNRLPLKRLDPDVLDILEENPWHGNVRELENLIQRLVVMVESATITARDLPQQLLYMSTTKSEDLLIPSEGIDFDEEMARIETAYLEAALRRSGGKKVTAANLLRIKPQKMKYLCRKYKIRPK